MKYQTKIAGAGLPPCHRKWVGGRCARRNESPPCCATRKPTIRKKPRYMSANWTWSVNTTVRRPPRSM